MKTENVVGMERIVQGERQKKSGAVGDRAQVQAVFVVQKSNVLAEMVEVGNPGLSEELGVVVLKRSLQGVEIRRCRKRYQYQ